MEDLFENLFEGPEGRRRKQYGDVEHGGTSARGGSFCAECGAHAAEGAKFCKECGEPIRATVPEVCSSCGGRLLEPAKFCPECGARIATPAR